MTKRKIFNDVVLILVVLAVVPNAIWWGFSGYFEMGRPFFNVDYFFSALVMVFMSRWVGAVLVVLAFFFDALALVGQVFPIIDVFDLLYLARFIPVAPWSYQVFAGFSVLFCLGFVSLSLYSLFRVDKTVFLVVINAFVLLYAAESILGEDSGEKVWRVSKTGLIGSQWVFAFESRQGAFFDRFDDEGVAFAEEPNFGVTEVFFQGRGEKPEKILLIVAESWGVSESAVMKAVLEPLYSENSVISKISQGDIDFSGITIDAEMRELCALRPLHFSFKDRDELSMCLPNILKKDGYKTFSMHGAAGLMYDRTSWYPKVGFDSAVFFESKVWERRCYSFPGACDADMFEELQGAFEQEGKVFYYWLTLNSHSIYDLRDLDKRRVDCEKLGIGDETQSCRNLNLHAQFFANLAEYAQNPFMSGVAVIVVGDHEPPILDHAEKTRNFKKGKVPWVRFLIGNGEREM
ncbi:hypothetical protein D4A39_13270 [Alcanivorax profundi]|uniref:Sulfatase N-terminal domain-containing protein n=1 Tax=Alcanivorax profundi TaxID=2338368 RepID=A0A418XVL7_9GAMM|nr:sulfatase-like hydrolase/transferase [Alcanivorax profundi]RJG16785.1 hypothetical protein D4A39_13270 [Alcanivorax profundi]